MHPAPATFALLISSAAALVGQEPSPQASLAQEARRLETVLELVRGRNARDYAIASPAGIDEARFVEVGGIEQWITIRGEDRRNPLLLFLHGGPGDATNPWGYAAFRPWLAHFTVVQWDQRGAARTLGRNGSSSAASITLERMTRDGLELSEYLVESLQQDKLLLVGHSWGSILGVLMVKARPELFHAFVGTGQVADPAKNYVVSHEDLLRKARALREERAVAELEGVGPPPYADGRGYAVQRRWSNHFEGADRFLASTLGLALGAPGSTIADVNDWFEGQGLSAGRLVPRTSALEAETLGGKFELPVFVVQGAEDFTTPTGLARAFERSVDAPQKAFVPHRGRWPFRCVHALSGLSGGAPEVGPAGDRDHRSADRGDTTGRLSIGRAPSPPGPFTASSRSGPRRSRFLPAQASTADAGPGSRASQGLLRDLPGQSLRGSPACRGPA